MYGLAVIILFLSQFYITFKETRHLDGKHVVFGRLVSGLAVLRKIAAVDTNSQDCPRTHVTIERCGSIQLLGDGAQVHLADTWHAKLIGCDAPPFRWRMTARKERRPKQKIWKRGPLPILALLSLP